MNTAASTVIAINSRDVTEVRHFENIAQARTIGNGFVFLRNVAELIATDAVPTAALVTIYNKLADQPVKRFSDRATASQRVWDIITSKIEVEKGLNMTQVNNAVAAAANTAGADKAKAAEDKKAAAAAKAETKAAAKKASDEAKATAKAEKVAAAAAKKAEKEAAKAAGKSTSTPRTSKFAGKLLKIAIGKDAEGNIKNPRRPGSHGFYSLAHIIDAGEAGITTEAYLKAGGRMNDLHWDVDHDNVKVEDAPAA